jgi:hypothetical protein
VVYGEVHETSSVAQSGYRDAPTRAVTLRGADSAPLVLCAR